MFRRRRRGFGGRRSFKRFGRRRKTMWAAWEGISGQEPYTTPFNEVAYYPLMPVDNTLLNTRFARQADDISLIRLVGRLRIGMYVGGDLTHGVTDYLAHWGIVIIPGDYDDSGTWTRQADAPDPVQPPDQDEPWLFKDFTILTRKFVEANGTDFSEQRPMKMSNESCLPNGDFIDISTRRRLRYSDKLFIALRIDGNADDDVEFFTNWNLRILIDKYR